MNGSSSGLVNGTPGTQGTLEQNELASAVAENENNVCKSESCTSKKDAIASTHSLPIKISESARRFFKGSSNAYNYFSMEKSVNGSYHLIMEKPGNVPGSKAIYHKIVDKNGKTIEVYKETFDPKGNLVHRKDKK